ncbi:unnamed protein product [Pedinophyceae sp. YPF-701]|nr:unnamed protein product [Pedinophyceae sp. YPF-701]
MGRSRHGAAGLRTLARSCARLLDGTATYGRGVLSGPIRESGPLPFGLCTEAHTLRCARSAAGAHSAPAARVRLYSNPNAVAADVDEEVAYVSAATRAPATTHPAPQSAAQPVPAVSERYNGLAASKHIRPEAAQEDLVHSLDALLAAAIDYDARYRRWLHDLAVHTRNTALLRMHADARVDAEHPLETPGEQAAAARPPEPTVLATLATWVADTAQRYGFPDVAAWAEAQVRALQSSPAAADTPEKRRAAAWRQARANADAAAGAAPTMPAPPRGILIHGSVGSGKTMCMDLFHAAAAEAREASGAHLHVLRTHFNAMMLEVNYLMHLEETRAAEVPTTKSHRAAVLAARRRTREEHRRAGDVAQLAASNSAIFAPVAHQLLYGSRRSPPEVARRAGERAAQAAWDARESARAQRALDVDWGSVVEPELPGGLGPAVLCLDELQVTDPFTAAALKGLLEPLLGEGAMVVATANRAIDEMPRQGLHEALFEHFTAELHRSCHEFALSGSDHRRDAAEASSPDGVCRAWVCPAPARQAPAASAARAADDAEVEAIRARLAALTVKKLHAEATAINLPGRGHLRRKAALVDALTAHYAAAAAAPDERPAPSSGSEEVAAVECGPGAGYFLLDAGGPSDAVMESAVALQLWSQLAGVPAASAGAPLSLPVMFNRTLTLQRVAHGAAWVDFADLCSGKPPLGPLGPADFLALARHCHTLLLTGVPRMGMGKRDQARRFITLVDELYNARTRLVCVAEAPPDELFRGKGGAGGSLVDGDAEPILDLEGLQFEGEAEGRRLRRDVMADGGVAPVVSGRSAVEEARRRLGGAEEAFAFARAVSRLYEMQTPMYWRAREPEARAARGA